MSEVLILKSDVINLNKVALQEVGKEEAIRLMDEGFHDAVALLIYSRKYVEMLNAFNNQLKPQAVEELSLANNRKIEVYSSKASLGNTGDRLNYKDDPIYVELKAKLDARTELLKLARKQEDPIYDAMGIEVPKVGLASVGAIIPKITL